MASNSPGRTWNRDAEASLDLARRLHRRRQERDSTGLLFAEGVRNFIRCVDHGVRIEAVIASRVLLTSVVAQKLVRRARRRGAALVSVSPEQYRSISTMDRASGIGAIVRAPWRPLESPVRRGCWLAVERVRSAGNLGTLIRTAVAVNAAGLIVLGHATDPFGPSAVRASMGAIFALPIHRVRHADLATWAAASDVSIVGATPHTAREYDRVGYSDRTIVMLGDERSGLSAAQERLCTTAVRIPMAPMCDSLNLGVAGSLMLYAVTRARRPLVS